MAEKSRTPQGADKRAITITVDSKGAIVIGEPGIDAVVSSVQRGLTGNDRIKFSVVDSSGEVKEPMEIEVPAKLVALLCKNGPSEESLMSAAGMSTADYNELMSGLADVSDVKLENGNVSEAIATLAVAKIAAVRREEPVLYSPPGLRRCW